MPDGKAVIVRLFVEKLSQKCEDLGMGGLGGRGRGGVRNPIPPGLFLLSESTLVCFHFRVCEGSRLLLPARPARQKPCRLLIDFRSGWGGFKPGLGPAFKNH